LIEGLVEAAIRLFQSSIFNLQFRRRTMKRRDLLGGGIVGGLIGAAGSASSAAAAEPAAAQRQQNPDFTEIVDAIDELRQQFAAQRQFTEITQIRDAQRLFLRANHKMPDFIEVGANHWFQLYDWHVRWQQELNLGRDSQGRYTILFMGTTVIMRPENQDGYIGQAYDLR
jgi:hypothetical protein